MPYVDISWRCTSVFLYVQDTFTSTWGALERLTQLFSDAVQSVSASDCSLSCTVFCTNSLAQEVCEIRCFGTRPFVITLFNARVPALRGWFRRIGTLASSRPCDADVKFCPSFMMFGALFRSFNTFFALFSVLLIINRRVCYAV